MAYRKGDAEIRDPADYGGDHYDARGFVLTRPFVALPHSCDAWIVGKAAEVETMIKDLTVLLAALRGGE